MLVEPHNAEIIVFNKGGRDFRLQRLLRGEETPREFLYGFLDLEAAGFRVAMLSSAGPVSGLIGSLANFFEKVTAGVTKIGARPLSARMRLNAVAAAKVVISFTDGFSLSLGLANSRRGDQPILIGGFQGLSDIEDRCRFGSTHIARALIRRAVDGLDHAFFFSPADRDAALQRYDLAANRSSILPFGVDTEFWRPLPGQPTEDFAFSIGQDPNRDFDCLAAAPGRHPTRIVTRLAVNVPPGSSHIQVIDGDFSGGGAISDEELRRLYNAARAVVLPLKDVRQATGQSVTMQAMSCGRPVILSNIRGLYAPELLKDGENCLLVPPGDAVALGVAIGRLRSDQVLSARLGCAARETAVAHFGLDKIGNATVALARHGLSLWSARQRHELCSN